MKMVRMRKAKKKGIDRVRLEYMGTPPKEDIEMMPIKSHLS
jgi:hypothetical protein